MRRSRSSRFTILATSATLVGVAAIAGVTLFANLSDTTRQLGGDPSLDVIVDARACQADSATLKQAQGTERVQVLGPAAAGCQVRLTVTLSGAENRFLCLFPQSMGAVLVATNRPGYTSDIDSHVVQLRPEDRLLYCHSL